MKHYLLFLPLLFLSLVGKSQLTKGVWFVGGSGSLFSYQEDYSASAVNVSANYTSVDLSASIGNFFLHKFCGGLRPYFSSYKGESSGGGSTNSYRLAIGPFARYYFLNTEKPFNILSDITYQFGINRDLGALHAKGKFNTLSIMAGTEMFFNTTAGLEILVGYRNQVATLNDTNGYNSNKKGLQVSIGFTLHLEGK